MFDTCDKAWATGTCNKIMGSISARPPLAAEQFALSFCYGGSSIHIKAEVNHGAGECTKEALSVMMGGVEQQLLVHHLAYFGSFSGNEAIMFWIGINWFPLW